MAGDEELSARLEQLIAAAQALHEEYFDVLAAGASIEDTAVARIADWQAEMDGFRDRVARTAVIVFRGTRTTLANVELQMAFLAARASG